MKINKIDRADALAEIKQQGCSKHEAIEKWLQMSQKEQKKFVTNIRKKKSRSRRY